MRRFKIINNRAPYQTPFVLVDNQKKINAAFNFLNDHYIKGSAKNTVRAYAYDLLELYRFLFENNISIKKLSQKDLSDFILAHRRSDASPRTINRRLIVARDFLNSQYKGLGDKLLRKNKTSFYKGRRNKALLGPTRIKKEGLQYKTLSVKIPSTILKPLKSDEIKRFLASLRTYRDQAMVYLMLFCGLRTHEVLNLEINDIDFIDSKITVKGKGLKERALPMPDSVRKTLNHYLAFERPEKLNHDRLITVLKGPHRGKPLTKEGLRMIFRCRRYAASLLRARPHLFRHTFCTNLIKQGVSLPVVQKLMGHSDIEVTMMYVHMGLDDVTKEYHQAMSVMQKPYEQKTS